MLPTTLDVDEELFWLSNEHDFRAMRFTRVFPDLVTG